MHTLIGANPACLTIIANLRNIRLSACTRPCCRAFIFAAHIREMNVHPLTVLTLKPGSRSQLARETMESESCRLLIDANARFEAWLKTITSSLQLGRAPKTCQRTTI